MSEQTLEGRLSVLNEIEPARRHQTGSVPVRRRRYVRGLSGGLAGLLLVGAALWAILATGPARDSPRKPANAPISYPTGRTEIVLRVDTSAGVPAMPASTFVLYGDGMFLAPIAPPKGSPRVTALPWLGWGHLDAAGVQRLLGRLGAAGVGRAAASSFAVATLTSNLGGTRRTIDGTPFLGLLPTLPEGAPAYVPAQMSVYLRPITVTTAVVAATWPLATTLPATYAAGADVADLPGGYRCAVLTGSDTAALASAALNERAGDVWVDSTVARPLAPGSLFAAWFRPVLPGSVGCGGTGAAPAARDVLPLFVSPATIAGQPTQTPRQAVIDALTGAGFDGATSAVRLIAKTPSGLEVVAGEDPASGATCVAIEAVEPRCGQVSSGRPAIWTAVEAIGQRAIIAGVAREGVVRVDVHTRSGWSMARLAYGGFWWQSPAGTLPNSVLAIVVTAADGSEVTLPLPTGPASSGLVIADLAGAGPITVPVVTTVRRGQVSVSLTCDAGSYQVEADGKPFFGGGCDAGATFGGTLPTGPIPHVLRLTVSATTRWTLRSWVVRTP